MQYGVSIAELRIKFITGMMLKFSSKTAFSYCKDDELIVIRYNILDWRSTGSSEKLRLSEEFELT